MYIYICGFVLVGAQRQQVKDIQLEYIDQRGEPALPSTARHGLKGIHIGGPRTSMYGCMYRCMCGMI